MSSEEFKPCPFCGGRDLRIEPWSVQPDDYHAARVCCDDCGLEGPSSLTLPDPDGCWMPDEDSAINEGIKAWNRRAQLAAIQGGMGEVAEVVASLQAERLLGNAGEYAIVIEKHSWLRECQRTGGSFDLMTVAQHQRITAGLAAEVERLKLLERVLDVVRAERDELVEASCSLRAELAEVKGLVKALETARDYVYCELENRKQAMAGYPHKWQQEEADLAEIDTALSTWRQAQVKP
jgi:Lar family restriction alleviation protein